MKCYLQYTDTAKDEAKAREFLDGLSIQLDYCGGRIIAPSPQKPGWHVQAFFKDVEPNIVNPNWYPDGIRRVVVLDTMRDRLGIVR